MLGRVIRLAAGVAHFTLTSSVEVPGKCYKIHILRSVASEEHRVDVCSLDKKLTKGKQNVRILASGK